MTVAFIIIILVLHSFICSSLASRWLSNTSVTVVGAVFTWKSR